MYTNCICDGRAVIYPLSVYVRVFSGNFCYCSTFFHSGRHQYHQLFSDTERQLHSTLQEVFYPCRCTLYFQPKEVLWSCDILRKQLQPACFFWLHLVSTLPLVACLSPLLMCLICTNWGLSWHCKEALLFSLSKKTGLHGGKWIFSSEAETH